MKKGNHSKPLKASELRNTCDPKRFNFKSTAELEDLQEIIGQKRATDAAYFGIRIKSSGFNIYAMGPSGMGKHSMIRKMLEEEPSIKRKNTDWCYINNFEESQNPLVLHLPSGMGPKLQRAMKSLIEELRTSIPATFESEAYRARTQEINEEYNEKEAKTLKEIQDEATQKGLTILRTPQGFAVSPVQNGEVMTAEDFEKLPEDERKQKEEAVSEMHDRLTKILEDIPVWFRERRKKEKVVQKEFTMTVVTQPINELKKKYKKIPAVTKYLNCVQEDIIDNVNDFLKPEESATNILGVSAVEKPSFSRYQVNVLVSHDKEKVAPIIYEDNPNYQNLVGRIDHVAQFGALMTDFTLIRPGGLHKANGGYIILDVIKLLSQPYAWEGLKRTLYAREINIEPLSRTLGLMSTVSIEPEPIPLDVKVVLLGDRNIYYLLCSLDPDFKKLFKVVVDFEEHIDRDRGSDQLYARFVASLARKEKLLHFDKSAVAKLIDHGARMTGDAKRLSTNNGHMLDILHEADYWAQKVGHELVKSSDVKKAIDSQIHRVDRIRERLYEEFERNMILIDTTGEKVGQGNALSVIQLGDFMFGQPSRITATTSVGEGGVIDIEREVEQGGTLHSKGVLILSGFLRGRYAKNNRLSLCASLAFEQTYGFVDGDSASAAELCVLISSIADKPIKQSMAVTGSVNQHGQIQCIGGVNEKIEGFFDICNLRGLTGKQGVIIPSTNVKNLMLREDVVKAVSNGKFYVYPVSTIDELIFLLMGIPAGEKNAKGNYPRGSINYLVEQRIQSFVKKAKKKKKS